jgi:transcriptional regulator with XRE-family HTH domain
MSYQLGKNIIYDHPLKREIYKQGYTVEAFADKCGLHRKTIIDICKKQTRTRGDTIFLLSKGLNMPYEKVEKLCRMSK